MVKAAGPRAAFPGGPFGRGSSGNQNRSSPSSRYFRVSPRVRQCRAQRGVRAWRALFQDPGASHAPDGLARFSSECTSFPERTASRAVLVCKNASKVGHAGRAYSLPEVSGWAMLKQGLPAGSQNDERAGTCDASAFMSADHSGPPLAACAVGGSWKLFTGVCEKRDPVAAADKMYFPERSRMQPDRGTGALCQGSAYPNACRRRNQTRSGNDGTKNAVPADGGEHLRLGVIAQ